MLPATTLLANFKIKKEKNETNKNINFGCCGDNDYGQ